MTTEPKIYITATEVASLLGISQGHAYKLVREMNRQLTKEGYLVIAGKVPTAYFEKRWYGFKESEVSA